MANKLQFKYPLIIAITFAFGMYFGTRLQKKLNITPKQNNSIAEIATLINKYYVDTLQTDSIIQKLQLMQQKTIDSLDKTTIANLLLQLDPHSVYLPPMLLKQTNEEMKGEFAGIGIEYTQYNDTIIINYIVPNGPAQKAKLQLGDKIIKVDDSIVSGIKITNVRLRKLLRGDINSNVKVTYFRDNSPFTTTITRGVIALPSIDANYMINDKIGYIKLGKFSLTSYKELRESITYLQKNGMQNLVLDLRDNGGGSLQDAVNIVDEFVSGKQLVTFTVGAKQPKQEYFTQIDGKMEQGKIAILIDENSASASEVVAGALQDLDRAIIIGRRSFGKGLVQRQFGLSNNAALRLTVARYYTPSGRCIQKSYANGKDAYEEDIVHRIKDKSLFVADSNKLDKSKLFKTKNGKIVYGGGGIMPDIFIALDTTYTYFSSYGKIQESGVINNFVNKYIELNRNYFNNDLTIKQFKQTFNFTNSDWEFFKKMCLNQNINISAITVKQKEIIIDRIKQFIARQIWRNNGFYEISNEKDTVLKKSNRTTTIMPQNNTKNTEFVGPNIIRFFCFLIVLLMHCNVLTNNIFIDNILLKAYPRFFLGVSFFFVLSAFLLTNLAIQEIESKKFSFKNFFIRRGLRIYPLYFTFILFVYFILPIFLKLFHIPNFKELPSIWYYLSFTNNYKSQGAPFMLDFLCQLQWKNSFTFYSGFQCFFIKKI